MSFAIASSSFAPSAVDYVREIPESDPANKPIPDKLTSGPQRRKSSTASTDPNNVRRRISRACDQCNQLRTKCDGKLPCLHCVEFSLQCEYARQRKKRGKASRRELAQKAAVNKDEGENAQTYDNDDNDADMLDEELTAAIEQEMPINQLTNVSNGSHELSVNHLSSGSHEMSINHLSNGSHDMGVNHLSSGSRTTQPEHEQQFFLYDSPNQAQQQQFVESPSGLSSFLAGTPQSPPRPSPIVSISTVHTSPPVIQTSPQQHIQQQQQQQVQSGQTVQQRPQAPSQPSQIIAPSWFNLVSPTGAATQEYVSSQRTANQIDDIALPMTDSQYPILSAVMINLLAFMPQPLAADLLEFYFGNNIYCLAPMLRKSSILSQTNPRTTSPSLIYAMLLSAAYTSDNPHMTSSPSARQDIIQHLQELCISSLRPLVHGTVHGTLDDVITYVHLGTVTSASEFKGSSLRWWNAAWALARELKLNTEHPDLDDETREEMRRTWWLLFIMDRHLGLCYNRPLAILDAQCMTLYHPLTLDEEWASNSPLTPLELTPDSELNCGITYSVTGDGIFGFFLPLMAILGGIVELHHLEQHPTMRLGAITNELRGHLASCLDTFERSMAAHGYAGAGYTGTSVIWRPYALHLLNVLRILLAGYWDPLDMLLAPDSLLTTSEFVKCTNHASDAADAIKVMLATDPELMYMPFFFGVYLLHGSFLWLVLVDKLESDVGEEVQAACETIVRAHEVCIVTLNTEYQRNFRRVMRGALVGMGKNAIGAAEREDGRRKRREIVGLYRWCAGGNGLAV